MIKDNENNKNEEEIDRKLNQEVTMEKLKTSKKDIKNFKTLEEIKKDKR